MIGSARRERRQTIQKLHYPTNQTRQGAKLAADKVTSGNATPATPMILPQKNARQILKNRKHTL